MTWAKDKDRQKARKYVGRFMWSFANVEAAIDNIFEVMFNLNAVSYFLLHNRLPVRQKVALIRLGFDHQGIAPGKMLGQVDQFSDIRNAIAHSSFEHVDSFTRIEKGLKIRYEAGIQFDYIDREGKIHVPDPAGTRHRKLRKLIKKRNMESIADDLLEKRTITYSEFDEYDVQLKELMESLGEIGCEPINEGINFVKDISKIIASSDNVVAFTNATPDS